MSNTAGGTVSAGASLTVYELAVTGQWDFSRGDLRATVGADLEYLGNTTNVTRFSDREYQWPDDESDGMREQFDQPRLLYAPRSQGANGGGHFVNQYTLVMDVMFPAPSSWINGGRCFRPIRSIMPATTRNFSSVTDSATPNANGIGAEGQFDGPLTPDAWYRIAFAVDLTAPAGQQLIKYVNGALVGSQSLSGRH